jgi:16S rRNA (cytosine967-C5)-methyltransferase
MSDADSGALPRAVAARALDQVLTHGRNLDSALADSGLNSLSDRDRPLAGALAYGAVRTHLRNSYIIDALVDRSFRNRDSVVVALLSVGLFALLESRRPDYAVVSATVGAATKVGKPKMKGVVNAILRRFLRERDELMPKVEQNLTAHWQHPEWMLELIRNDWPEDWQEILNAGNQQAPMWLRLNTNRIGRAKWLKNFAGPAEAGPAALATAVKLSEPTAVSNLPGFMDGDCSVQDVASQAAAGILAPEPGMRVLDACAAPGGKATHLLEFCPGIDELVALDVSEERLVRVQENLDRLGLKASIVCGDAGAPDTWWDGQMFDRILIDAPCSATGVIRRHPDIRFLRKPHDIAALAKQQLALLRKLWLMLKPGGRMLYATCSVLRAENEQVIADFLGNCENAIELSPDLGMLEAAEVLTHGVQLLPGRIDNDGFYYALIEKQAAA